MTLKIQKEEKNIKLFKQKMKKDIDFCTNHDQVRCFEYLQWIITLHVNFHWHIANSEQR